MGKYKMFQTINQWLIFPEHTCHFMFSLKRCILWCFPRHIPYPPSARDAGLVCGLGAWELYPAWSFKALQQKMTNEEIHPSAWYDYHNNNNNDNNHINNNKMTNSRWFSFLNIATLQCLCLDSYDHDIAVSKFSHFNLSWLYLHYCAIPSGK